MTRRSRDGRSGWAALLCAAVALAVACQGKFQKRLTVPSDLRASALIVYPFRFRWDEPAYRSFELSHRLLGVAIQRVGSSVLLFGPPEFKVFRAEDDNAWAASTAVSLLPAFSIRPEEALVLRPWAEKREASSHRELLDPKGRTAAVTSSRETVLIGHLDMVHPSSQHVVVQLSGEARVDPFSERIDEADPTPELTRLMEELTVEALAAIGDRFRPPGSPRELGVTVAFNPALAIVYAEEGRPALDLQLARMSPLEAEVLRLSRVRFANPGLSDTEAAKLARLPGGLYVRSTLGGKLHAGDLITAIDDHPALPQALQRARFGSAPARCRVRNASGDFSEAILP